MTKAPSNEQWHCSKKEGDDLYFPGDHTERPREPLEPLAPPGPATERLARLREPLITPSARAPSGALPLIVPSTPRGRRHVGEGEGGKGEEWEEK